MQNRKGGLQLLFWDFTHTHPGDSVNNQHYYIRNLPSNPKGTVRIQVAGMPAGTYKLEIYKIGYGVNDPYTTYFFMNKPKQLTVQQVNAIKQKNDGTPVSVEMVLVDSKGVFARNISINENDVLMLNFVKQ